MILEITGSRIIAPYFGNSLFVWGSLIGVILAALSSGYYYGGKMADRKPSAKTLSLVILQAGVAVAFVPLLSAVILQPDFAIFFGMTYGPLISVIVLFSVPSFLLGIVSPYAVKLETKKLKSLGNTAGNLYAISTAGSIVGTLLTAFFLIPALGIKAIIFGTGLLLIFTALIMSYNLRSFFPCIILSLVVCVALIATSPLYASASQTDYIIVYQVQTPYHQITIKDWVDSGKRIMYLDASKTGGMYKDSDKAVCEYTDYFHLPFIINPEIKDVLVIGCGAGIGPKNFHSNFGDVRVDVVDIDPQVNEAAVRYFDLREDERLKLYVGDARVFLSKSDKKYDLIVVDAFSSVYSIPFHLMTKEFAGELNSHLSDDGVVVLNVIASVRGDASKIFRAEYRTYETVFPSIYVFPVGEDPLSVQNIMIVASGSGRRYSKSEFVEQANRFYEKTGIPKLIECSEKYLEGEVLTDDVPVLTDDYAPVDNLLNPTITEYYRVIW